MFAIMGVLVGGCVVVGMACNSSDTAETEPETADYARTVTEPTGYVQVDISPSEVEATIGQQVTIKCNLLPLVDTIVTISSVKLVIFDSHEALLNELPVNVIANGSVYERQTTFTIGGNESFFKILIDYYFGTLGNPTQDFSEYTADSVSITILQ